MSIEAPQLADKSESEVRLAAVSFAGRLDDGVLLTGTPTVTDATAVLTLSSKVVSTGNLTINDATVLTGQAVQFLVSGGTAGTTYAIRIACDTDGSPTETLRGRVRMRVVAD